MVSEFERLEDIDKYTCLVQLVDAYTRKKSGQPREACKICFNPRGIGVYIAGICSKCGTRKPIDGDGDGTDEKVSPQVNFVEEEQIVVVSDRPGSWTEDEVELLKLMVEKGDSAKIIASKLERSVGAIRSRIYQLKKEGVLK